MATDRKSEPRRESAIQAFLSRRRGDSPREAGVVAAEKFAGYVNLRGDPEDPGFAQAAGQAVAFDLPGEVNAFTRGNGRCACRLGPDEWLIQTRPDEDTALAAELRKALHGRTAAVTVVSGGFTTIRLSGPDTRELLAKGCMLDFHPRAFAPGHCAQTLLAKATVLIRRTDDAAGDAPAWEIVVRNSFAEYLMLWVEDAADEYGFSVEA